MLNGLPVEKRLRALDQLQCRETLTQPWHKAPVLDGRISKGALTQPMRRAVSFDSGKQELSNLHVSGYTGLFPDQQGLFPTGFPGRLCGKIPDMSGISIPQILQAEMDRRGLNPHSLALEAGLKQDAVRDILRGKSQSPRGATIKKLAAFLGMSVGDLLGVEGLKFGSEVTPPRLVEVDPDHLPAAPDRPIEIKEYDATPRAGHGAAAPELDGDGSEHPVLAVWQMPSSYLSAFVSPGSKLAIVRVSGDSMEPDYPAGERILVDTSHQVPSPPGVYVLWDGFGLVLKRVEILLGSDPPRVRIKSINPAYDTYERALDEVIINGRVVGKWVWK